MEIHRQGQGLIIRLPKDVVSRLGAASDLHFDKQFPSLSREIFIDRCGDMLRLVTENGEQGLVLLVGDVFDLLTTPNIFELLPHPREFEQIFDIRMCLKKLDQLSLSGIPVIYISGNHDRAIYELEAELRRYITGELHLCKWAAVEHDSGKLFALHGDFWDKFNREAPAGVKPVGDLIVEQLIVPMQRRIQIGEREIDCSDLNRIQPHANIPLYLRVLDPSGALNEEWFERAERLVHSSEFKKWAKVTHGFKGRLVQGFLKLLLSLEPDLGNLMEMAQSLDRSDSHYLDRRLQEFVTGTLDDEDIDPEWRDFVGQTDIVIAGHSHKRRLLRFNVQGRLYRYANTGAWVKSLEVLQSEDGAPLIEEYYRLIWTNVVFASSEKPRLIQTPYYVS